MSSAEIIDETGRKSAIAGGAKAGGYWAAQPSTARRRHRCHVADRRGNRHDVVDREATGHPVIASLSCGNLEPVAKEMRAPYPAAALIIIAEL